MTQAAVGAQGAIAKRAPAGQGMPRGREAPGRRSDAPWAAAGNQVLQRLFASGMARASLKVGGADDPEEREADRTADALMQGSACTCSPGAPPCSLCRANSSAKLRRKARRRGDAGGAEAGNLALGGGRPLAAADRHFFEPRLGADLAGVRLHTGSAAERATQQVGARAFALGNDIVFGRDELRPQTLTGRRLLAHELAHVVHGHGGLRRDDGPDMTPASATCEPEVPEECSMLDPATVPHAADFNPCDVNVGNLTNYELLAEYRNALGVVNRGRGAAGYFDYRNLQRRLIAERDRRVDMGHAWLATMPESLPDPLYRIVERGGGLFDVVAVPGATVAGAPENVASSPLMTQAQFDHFLETRNIERVDADTYLMRTMPTAAEAEGGEFPLGFGPYFPVSPSLWPGMGTAGLPAAEPFTPIELPSVFSRAPWFERLPGYTQEMVWAMPGAMDPERTRSMARALARYRATPGVPELVDVEGRPRAGGTAAVAETDIPTLSRRTFGGASAEALPPGMRGAPGTTGGSVLVPANPTAVSHGEHVALENLRRALVAAIENGEIRRSDLRGRTVFVLVEQEPCSSCVSGWREGRPGVLQQFSELFPELTVEVRDLRTMGSRIYRGGVPLTLETPLPAWPPPEPATVFEPTPEFLRSRALGGGLPGTLRAGGGSALRGGGLGGLVMVVTSAGVMAFDEAEHPNWEAELALTGGLGTLAGGTGAFTEHMLITGGTRIMLSDVAATGASRLTPGLVTGAGRFGGGAVGAMFIEGISMGLLEEREHSGLEVGTRLGRSAALGGGSVWAGAAIGTAVGGPVGFIVGLAVGGLLYYVGDKLVPGGREDWDAIEAGCRPLPSLSRLSGAGSSSRPFTSPMFTCFDGETPILMSDGTRKPIERIVVGDRVLGYNEQDRTVEERAVTKVHRASPAPLLQLLFDNGVRLRVTASHKLAGPAGWRCVGDLRPGDGVFRVTDADGLEAVTLASIAELVPRGPVYDLSVDAIHTYFAAGILAHNKI